MTVRVAVDFGTSSTCVALSVSERDAQVVAIDGQPLLSSAVYSSPDGTVFVGQEADRQAAVDPSRYEPHPKRRIDEGELLLGNAVLTVREVVRTVLQRSVSEARRVAGGASVDQLVLTHPADWGGIRSRVLRQAANGLADRIVLVPEPVAAAVFHAANFAAAGTGDGAALAVLDLGGGTVDVSVVRKRPGPVADSSMPDSGFEVLATRGDPSFGGADVDQLLLEHVGAMVSKVDPEAWRELVEGRQLADRRRRRVLRQDVRGAKETLSRHTYTDVPLPPPFPDAHVTRDDLERLISGRLGRAAELTVTTIREAGLTPHSLSGIFLVGGSSRIPMVGRLVHERTGVVPTTLDQPETVVARGALRAVSADPSHTGVYGVNEGVTATDLTRPTPRRLAHEAPRPEEVTTRLTTRQGPPRVPPHRMAQHGVPQHHPERYPVPTAARVAEPVSGNNSGTNRTRLFAVIGVVVLIAALVVVLVLVLRDGQQAAQPPAQQPSTPIGETSVEPERNGREIAQYDYKFTMPDDWKQTGGDAAKRLVQVRPSSAETGLDQILVEERALAYDSDLDRPRAVNKLRSEYEAAGSAFSGLDMNARFANKDVIYYRQQVTGATVDWYVMFKGSAQVSVGCQHTESGRARVRNACENVVRTMAISAS
ncbi:chaperone protein HscA [Herbihabitans rhizosphaerae]|uniref:Chaperone protein HscA n=1 Tax=Herbihabitans rhizosphaerae TaxID=1872711 RepID=A0A4Q7KPD9_9PSEU|nr:type VII secretion-associated protein [Herbihabitans rhizosphaerae]RZS37132.1 chaperone protein HscA [Herbihabitans rhizosphaerae]